MNTLVHHSMNISMILPNRHSHLSLDRHYQYNQGQWWAVIGRCQLAKTEIEGQFVGQLWFQTAQGQFETISNSLIWVTHTHGLYPHGVHIHDHVGMGMGWDIEGADPYPYSKIFIHTTHHVYIHMWYPCSCLPPVCPSLKKGTPRCKRLVAKGFLSWRR